MEFKVEQYDRMFCYLWYEKSDSNECKFGERWVPSNNDPLKSCHKRVRESVGVRKDKYDSGEVVLLKIWDVTEYAKSINRYYKGSRVDDAIREHIGFRKGTTGEIHTIDANTMAIKVNKFLTKFKQPLPIATLSTGQYNAAIDTINLFNNNKNIILAELCARFGKTIYSGAVSTELNSSITIVASYVKTVFTSFEVDLTSFEQFKDIEHINADDKKFEQKVNDALIKNKKIFVYLSLCQGSQRQKRIEYLFNLTKDRLLIIDEADFGAHKPGQSKPLIDLLKKNDKVLIMTGTNADRAASLWNVDSMISTTYFELLGHKNKAKNK